MGSGAKPKFVRRYGDLHGAAVDAVSAYAHDVRHGHFPNDSETYHASADVAEVTVAPATLTFTTGNWNTPQNIVATNSYLTRCWDKLIVVAAIAAGFIIPYMAAFPLDENFAPTPGQSQYMYM